MTEQACQDANGAYGGAGSACTANACVGACCQPSRVCADTPIHQCAGHFRGPRTSCATAPCPCQTPVADFDEDGDVDGNDFGGFQRCYTGAVGGVPAGCECFNRDNDDDVDEQDLEKFANCATRAGVALDVQSPPAGCLP